MPERPPFRHRLTVRLGIALAVALLGVGVSVWVGAAAWAAHEARGVLRTEVAAVQDVTVAPDGTLDVDRYDWDEPHHLRVPL